MQAARDNLRDNDLETSGWRVLRFNTKQINKQMGSYCVRKIQGLVNELDGLSDEGLVPRIFYPQAGENVQQLSMFERAALAYKIEEAAPPEYEE